LGKNSNVYGSRDISIGSGSGGLTPCFDKLKRKSEKDSDNCDAKPIENSFKFFFGHIAENYYLFLN
jgi:hypothetical protein